MSQPAAQLFGADLDQLEPVDLSPEALEARRLAQLAGEFCLCGLNICLDETYFSTAEQAYLAEDEPTPEPANDAAPSFAFPDLPQRGLHIHPAAPIKLIQSLDWLVVLVVAQTAALWGADMGLFELSIGAAAAFLCAAGSLKAGLWLTESYRVTPASIRAERGIGGLALGVILGLGVSTFFAPDARSSAALAATLPVAAMLLAGVHAALAVLIRAAHRKGVFSENVVLIGATDAAERMIKRARKSGEARIIAIVDDRLSRVDARHGSAPVGGNLDDLLKWEGLPQVDRIVITVTQKAEGRVREMIERLRAAPNRVDLLLDYQTVKVRGRGVDRLTGAAVACVSGRPRNHRRALVKRAQDVVLSAAILALLALPMLAIALAIRCGSKGPALHRQQRHGFNNRVITIAKFRTLRPGGRVTRIGAFLRRTGLDDLPQLFTVLRGDMSLVGPRPHAVALKAADRDAAHIVAEYAQRHCVKPGITGWAQINGAHGTVDTPAALRRRVKLDLEYVSRASLWLDLEILARTLPMMFAKKAA